MLEPISTGLLRTGTSWRPYAKYARLRTIASDEFVMTSQLSDAERWMEAEVYKNSVATNLKVTSITKRLLGDPRIKYSSEVKKKALGKLKNESVSEIVCFHHFLI